jgi:hypothetical protein
MKRLPWWRDPIVARRAEALATWIVPALAVSAIILWLACP